MRVGIGYDVHAYGDGDHVTLGGVRIAHTRGVIAHSDGDVALHALCDALLGAMALGDIGEHFPDSDPRWKGADSRTLLRHVFGLVQAEGWQVGNVDATVIAEQPKLAPFVAPMRAHIALDLQCGDGQVSVKATTTEHLGFTGRGEGIAALATVLLERPRREQAG
jgi:2-C-methyl-D-erythritol 2,4-cyclodiphosphate synthase